VPQWNCSCPNCRAAREGLIPKRSQSSVAIGGDTEEWFLVNASPDLAQQIESFPPLHPRDKVRSSPIKAVLLTNADLDHALGLLLLRQRDSEQIVYASADARKRLSWMDPLLHQFSGIEWRHPPVEFAPLTERIEFRRIDLPASVAYEFRDLPDRKTVLIAPSVPEVNADMLAAIKRAHLLLFDGTFWSDEELQDFRPNARTSKQMGHLPVEESLELLRGCAGRRIYMHINNTNPILQPGSAERRKVEDVGVEIGEDGMEFKT
jgi:pyrroloquinoline quinone biosynthesis protein B